MELLARWVRPRPSRLPGLGLGLLLMLGAGTARAQAGTTGTLTPVTLNATKNDRLLVTVCGLGFFCRDGDRTDQLDLRLNLVGYPTLTGTYTGVLNLRAVIY